MRVKLTVAACLALALGVGLFVAKRPAPAAEDDRKGPMLVHNVFFSLKDDKPASRKKLVAACKKYLTKHPGEVYFAVGPLAADLKRPVNDTDFDVALTIVFKDRASHDAYQDARRHLAFIEENKDNWKKVRVFDSYTD